jgi:hypothetical protein
MKTMIAVLLAAMTMGGLATTSASASQVLTLYAGGEALPLGHRDEPSQFHLKSSVPFTITVPSTGLTTTCTPSKEPWALSGWLTANGTKTVRARFGGEGGLDEIRHCSNSITVAGPQLAGRLRVKANGESSLVTPLTSGGENFDMVVGACIYDSKLLQGSATIGGPLEVTLHGTFTSDEEKCAPAEFEIGPFQATWGPSNETIEALVSEP